jgi:hypothetical protein
VICALYGGDLPFVTRVYDGTIILIGETCLHGFMHGDALDIEGATVREFKLR